PEEVETVHDAGRDARGPRMPDRLVGEPPSGFAVSALERDRGEALARDDDGFVVAEPHRDIERLADAGLPHLHLTACAREPSDDAVCARRWTCPASGAAAIASSSHFRPSA